MAKRFVGAPLKDPAREHSLLSGRMVVAACLMVVALLVVIARIGDLQIAQYEDFKTRSHNNRVKLVPVPPTRGLIRDRNGVLLAHNVPTFSLEMVPEAVSDVDGTLAALGTLVSLTEDDISRFRQALRRTRRFDSVVIRSRLSEAEVARFAVNRYRFPGIDVHARLTREYPLGSLAVHVLGYVGRISEPELERIDATNYLGTTHIGKTGVERSYETVLHGRVGHSQVETNAEGRTLRVLESTDPVPGASINLTIDIALQATAEAAMEGRKGAVVAIDPSTGEVLALVSLPGYDPNLFVHGIDVASFRALNESPGRPLFNRALAGRYPPGSTVKPFFGLGALEAGNPLATSTVRCHGFYQLKGHKHRYRDWKRSGHGKVDLHEAVAQSCDVYFYALALEAGIDQMHDFMTEFGFGTRTGIDLPSESRGLMPSREWKQSVHNQPWFPGETLITGIGQGFMLATPVQLAAATATLAERGTRLTPRIVRSVEVPGASAPTTVTAAAGPTVRIRNPQHWADTVSGMIAVVHSKHGTARAIGEDSTVQIAGKTGTAQVFTVGQDDEYDKDSVKQELRDHGLFVAFAPPDQPKIAVAVIVENGGSGSRSAAPVARRIIDAYLGSAAQEISSDTSVTDATLERVKPSLLAHAERSRHGY